MWNSVAYMYMYSTCRARVVNIPASVPGTCNAARAGASSSRPAVGAFTVAVGTAPGFSRNGHIIQIRAFIASDSSTRSSVKCSLHNYVRPVDQIKI